ncbi:MAG: protein arginine kinase [Tissierellia bacterium]|nr:protein arginine kinase [Tissierellia bacterium]
MGRWLEEPAEQDVVISTRIRVARNLKDYTFPLYMSVEESDNLTNEVLQTVKDEFSEANYRFYRISDLSQKERLMFVEEHLISPSLMEKLDKSSFLVRDDEKATIMINEEDHLRIQILLAGLKFEEAWLLCSEIDDKLEAKLNFAYDAELGYLTACPTNVGTGLRASVMVHLPCLAMVGNINALIEALRKVGLTLRGMYGEGTKGLGNLYQISNQTTLGETEEEIINKLNKLIQQVVSKERKTREYLKEKKGINLEDTVYRSYGILKNSRLITSKEAMKHLSNVKLGYDLKLIDNPNLTDIFKLMVDIKPATIQMNTNKDLTIEERDKIRAEIIRERL